MILKFSHHLNSSFIVRVLKNHTDPYHSLFFFNWASIPKLNHNDYSHTQYCYVAITLPLKHSLSSAVGFWVIGDGSVTVNVQVSASDVDTIIDSGSTIITAPTTAADAFWKQVQGSKPFEQGLYTFPCDSVPQAAFSWGGKKWAISGANFNVGQVSKTMCVGAIVGQDLGLGTDVWLLGDR